MIVVCAIFLPGILHPLKERIYCSFFTFGATYDRLTRYAQDIKRTCDFSPILQNKHQRYGIERFEAGLFSNVSRPRLRGMKISVIFGTRPEAVKTAPVILALKNNPAFTCHVCVTAQHRSMLDQVLQVFGIVPDVDLDLMRPEQTLSELTRRVLEGLDCYLLQHRPDMILVQGDTTTVFAATLAAFYHHIPIGHMEAGLRTGDLSSPWPEEANRVLTTRLANLHFAPTVGSRNNLLNEKVPDQRIVVTGNTVIDALMIARDRIRAQPPMIPGLPDFLQPPSSGNLPVSGDAAPRMVLITGHRRENMGAGFSSICMAIALLASDYPDVHFVYPVHLNPRVHDPVYHALGGNGSGPIPNIHLIPPLDYLPFVALMNRSCLILTDSGGVQEEAPSLGKPVLVLRNTTERPEAVEAGTVRLVGTDHTVIRRAVATLLTDEQAYQAMSRAHNPYGDGKAAQRHLDALTAYFLRSL
jgi:UDP-N-acetylglucosamine 2-epimerase (non-hydrolysing)